jgi:hypothetical protein
MIMRRLFIGFVIFLGLLALGALWTIKEANDYYFRTRPITYDDLPAAQAAGAPGLDCLQMVIPKGSRDLCIWVAKKKILGDFDFPSGEFAALKQRASQINGALVKEDPEDHATMFLFSAHGKDFYMIVRPTTDDPSFLHAEWEQR